MPTCAFVQAILFLFFFSSFFFGMATTTLRPQNVFSDEAVSLRSFRFQGPSGPPSLKASSLKVRTTFALSNLLTSVRRAPAPTSTSKSHQPTIRIHDLSKEVEKVMGSPLRCDIFFLES